MTLLTSGLAALGLCPVLAGAASASPRPARAAAATYLNGVSCPDAGNCWAVGEHTHPLGQPVAAIERMQRAAWSAVPAPEPAGATYAVLSAVSCASAGACLAVGWFSRGANNALFPLAERWDGTRWSLVKVVDPPDSSDTALSGAWCTGAKNCWAVGNYLGDALAEHWNGTRWAVYITAGGKARLLSVTCSNGRNCWATGSAKAGTVTQRWNGTTWSAVTTPTSGSAGSALDGVSCSRTAACMAVGSGASGSPLAQRWNGSAWTVTAVKSPPPATFLGTFCTSGSACLAVGTRGTGPTSEATLAVKWTGSRWSAQATPNRVNWPINILAGISCPAATNCWAVGGSLSSGEPGLARRIIEHWNGTTWSLVG